MKGWRVQPQYYYKLPLVYQDIIEIEQYDHLDYDIVRDQVKLTLNKEKSLRLADLHFLLNIQYQNQRCMYTNLCQFQVLQVIRMIAEHLYQIEQKGLVHNNLNKQNIWIRFGQTNLNTYYNKELQIEQIYFVNYDTQQNKCDFDFKIIQLIFQEFIGNLQFQEVEHVIYEKALTIKDSESLKNFINLVKEYEITLRQEDIEVEQNLQIKPELEMNQNIKQGNQPFQNQLKSQIKIKSNNSQLINENENQLQIQPQQTNQTQSSFKIFGYALPNLGIKEKIKQNYRKYIKRDNSKSVDKMRQIHCSRCISKQIQFPINNEKYKDERLRDLKERLDQHQFDCLYKEQFRMFAYDFEMNSTVSNDQTVNNRLKLIFDSVQCIINSIFKGMEPDFVQLDSFTKQMDQAFNSEFRMDLDMKGVDIKQIYCDLLYQWLTNDVEDLQSIFNANVDGIKPILMKKTKIQYQKIHKEKFELEVQQLVNQLL